MAAYEGPGQNETTSESITNDYTSDDENDDLSESKSFYMVPTSFVIHTYSRVQPDSITDSSQTLSTQFSPYRHKVTMFKVFLCVAVEKMASFMWNIGIEFLSLPAIVVFIHFFMKSFKALWWYRQYNRWVSLSTIAAECD